MRNESHPLPGSIMETTFLYFSGSIKAWIQLVHTKDKRTPVQ
jgi:hypothetical protein